MKLPKPLSVLAAIFSEQRNYAVASGYRATKSPKPIYTTWTIERAVAEGYKANPWVYRSVYLKAKAGSSVPWYVVDEKGEKIDGHPITTLFKRPNPFLSRQDLFELIISWLELSGNSYLKKIKVNGRTEELWPISPDRAHPIPSTDTAEWFAGFALDKSKKVDIKPEDMIHHKYFNPANPLLGIAPLEAVAKTVDIDNGQKDFNKATTQNRGVIDGYFVFDKEFGSQQDTDAVREKLNEVHRNKRTFGVLGSNAKYIRTALTPAEMDFIDSGKANREEVFIAFGVPPVYAGIMDGATMNNYKTSELIFWFGTMLFLLDDMKDTFNFSLADEIGEGNELVYDLSNVPAIREAMLAKTKTAKGLFEMGVPFEQLNKVFGFGFEEFEGWDVSNPGKGAGDTITNDSATREKFTLVEVRSDENELAISREATKNAPAIFDVLQTQQEAVFDALNEGRGADVDEIIEDTRGLLTAVVSRIYIASSVSLGTQVVLEQRALEDILAAEVAKYLKEERTILTEVSYINATTVDKILDHVRSAIDTGMTTTELQQAIIDSGIFNEKRALMLSRTISGTASSIGQFKGAEIAGADQKTWSTAGFEVRDSHKKMEGKTIPINDFFTVGKDKAMFP